jgi:hypothetical protein
VRDSRCQQKDRDKSVARFELVAHLLITADPGFYRPAENIGIKLVDFAFGV